MDPGNIASGTAPKSVGVKRRGRGAAAARSAAAEADAAAAAEESLDLDALADVDMKEVYRALLKEGWRRNESRKRARTEHLLGELQGWQLEMR